MLTYHVSASESDLLSICIQCVKGFSMKSVAVFVNFLLQTDHLQESWNAVGWVVVWNPFIFRFRMCELLPII